MRSERLGSDDSVLGCRHGNTVTTLVAGLARTVCEVCGMVSIRHLGDRPASPEPAASQRGGRAVPPNPVCKRCGDDAYFITPWGLACSDHAWEAASRQDPLHGDFWIPLIIDRSDVAG